MARTAMSECELAPQHSPVVKQPSGLQTDVQAPCSSQTDTQESKGDALRAGGAIDDAESGAEGAEQMASVDDLEWDDVLTLWANAHACYIEKDRSIVADAKRCVSVPRLQPRIALQSSPAFAPMQHHKFHTIQCCSSSCTCSYSLMYVRCALLQPWLMQKHRLS